MRAPDTSALARLRPVWPAWGLILLGAVPLIGWATHAQTLQSFLPGMVPLEPRLAAFAFFGGISLLLADSPRPVFRVASRLLAVILFGSASSRLADSLVGWPQVAVFASTAMAQPQSLAPLRSIALFLATLGLLAASFKWQKITLATAIVVGALGLMALSSEVFVALGEEKAEALQLTVPGVAAYILLSIGLLTSSGAGEFASAFSSPRVSGKFLRSFFPLALFMPLVIGVLTREAVDVGFIEASSRASIDASLTGLLLGAVTWALVKQQRLHESESDKLTAALADNVARLRLLHAVTSDPRTSFPDKATALLLQVRETLGFEHALLLRLEGDLAIPELISSSTPEQLDSVELSSDDPLRMQTLAREGPCVLGPMTDTALHALGQARPEGILSHRIVVDGEPYGILLFVSTHRRKLPFAPDDLDQMRLIVRWIEFELNTESARRALSESEQRFKNLVKTMPGMAFQFWRDNEGRPHFTYASEGAREIFGVAPQALLDDPDLIFRIASDPETLASIKNGFDRAEKTMSIYHAAREYRMSNGQGRWVETFAQPQRDDSGEVQWTGVAIDISEQRSLEQELDSARNRLSGILSSVDDVIFSLTPDTSQTTYVSDAATRLLGHWPEEFLNDSELFFKGVHEEDREGLTKEFQDVAAGKSLDSEVRYFLRDGRMLWLRVRAHLAEDENGKPIRIDGITTDVTRRKTSEQALEAARADAEKANAAKSEFLSRMSHELRTPMNAILGFAQLLELEDLSVKQRDSVEYILKAGRHLLELVNEVLDISRIESGTLAMSLEPVELSRAIREVVALVRPLASAREISIEVEDDSRPGLHVLADRQRLRQVFLNLLSNGIKYSPFGGAVVIRQSLGLDRAIIDVIDQGAGLQASQIERLFIPFDRLGAETSGIEGTGLGLPLAKRLLEGMGGDLEVRTAPGAGSTFSVLLKIATAPAAVGLVEPHGKTENEDARQAEVLLIEDNLSNVHLIEEVVRSLPNMTLVSAMQGRLGFDLARKHPPALILLDVNLPDVDGLDLLRQIRAERLLSTVPIIVLSADATSRQIQRAKDAGANAYVTKPFNLRQFIDTVTAFVSGREATWKTMI